MREASTGLIYELLREDRRVMALTADGRNGIYERIRDEFPENYVDYGIAESNMIASAAGLAAAGKIPFVFGASTFLAMRAFEFIRNDVCIANQNVKMIGIFCGLCRGSWGATHQGTEELALLRGLPNLTVITPATPIEAREAVRFAYKHQGPVYLRLEASGEREYLDETNNFKPGKGICLRNGKDGTIITMGSIAGEALEVAEELSGRGKEIRVISLSTLLPVDEEMVLSAAQETGRIVTLEEHSRFGGLGSTVAEILAENGCAVGFRRLGLEGCAHGCGDREFMRNENGIGRKALLEALEGLF